MFTHFGMVEDYYQRSNSRLLYHVAEKKRDLARRIEKELINQFGGAGLLIA
jgi:hypothetical protein